MSNLNLLGLLNGEQSNWLAWETKRGMKSPKRLGANSCFWGGNKTLLDLPWILIWFLIPKLCVRSCLCWSVTGCRYIGPCELSVFPRDSAYSYDLNPQTLYSLTSFPTMWCSAIPVYVNILFQLEQFFCPPKTPNCFTWLPPYSSFKTELRLL